MITNREKTYLFDRSNVSQQKIRSNVLYRTFQLLLQIYFLYYHIFSFLETDSGAAESTK